jgi:sensor histidine kinase regulating citrate/malate metabolism
MDVAYGPFGDRGASTRGFLTTVKEDGKVKVGFHSSKYVSHKRAFVFECTKNMMLTLDFGQAQGWVLRESLTPKGVK